MPHPSLHELRQHAEESLRQADLSFSEYQKELATRELKMGKQQAESRRMLEVWGGPYTPPTPEEPGNGTMSPKERGDCAPQSEVTPPASPSPDNNDVLDDILLDILEGRACPANADSEEVLKQIDKHLDTLKSSVGPPEKREAVRIRVQAVRDLVAKWSDLLPKEEDGSVRVPGGEFMSFSGKVLVVGDFTVYRVVDDASGAFKVYLEANDSSALMFEVDASGECNIVDDVFDQGQEWAVGLLERLRIPIRGSKQHALPGLWSELMFYLGGHKYLSRVLQDDTARVDMEAHPAKETLQSPPTSAVSPDLCDEVVPTVVADQQAVDSILMDIIHGEACPANPDTEKVVKKLKEHLVTLAQMIPDDKETHTAVIQRVKGVKELVEKWADLLPKEEDGSVRIPGGDLMVYRDGVLNVGEFAAFRVEEDREGNSKVFFEASASPVMVIEKRANGTVKEQNDDALEQGQEWAVALINRLHLPTGGSTKSLPGIWSEMMHYLGAHRSLAELLLD